MSKDHNSFQTALGHLIISHRTQKGWTQAHLAGQAFGNEGRKGEISLLENGKGPKPNADTIDRLCNALEIDGKTIHALRQEHETNKDAKISELTDKISLMELTQSALIHANHDQLITIATKFNIPNAADLSTDELRTQLFNQAEQLTELQARVKLMEEKDPRYANLLGAARDALNAGNISEARTLIRDARNTLRVVDLIPALARDAEFSELDARAALAQNNAQEAYDILSASADSFAALDADVPLQLRLNFATILFDHALRYGGNGLQFAAQMNRAVIDKTTPETHPELWGNAQNNLAAGLRNQGSRTGGAAGTALLNQAVTAYRDALTVRTKADHPVDWAMTQNNLAAALQEQGTRTGGAEGTDLLHQAVTAYRDALTVRTKADHPVDWAMTQNNLAVALQEQGIRTGGAEGTALLNQAVTAYRDALTVYTKADHPVDWAMTQNNLAAALAEQGICTGGAEGTALLHQAVTAYRDALTVYTKADHPVDWAMTQNNLAVALQQQGSRTGGAEGTALLNQAVTAYRDALTVRTKADHPVHWATTQNNLAVALQEQGSRTGGAEGTDLLHQSVTACRDALTVCTKADHPVDWAMTQYNLAIVFAALATRAGASAADDFTTALSHVEAALTVFDPEHMAYNHKNATELRDIIIADLAKNGD